MEQIDFVTLAKWIKDAICYQWYEALLIAFIIVALLYPIILLCKRHIPLLFGKYPIKL